MNPFKNKSEYAISTWLFETADLKKALELISDEGFKSVELWADTVHFDPRAKLNTNDIASWIKQYGLHIHSAHAPFRHFFNRPEDDMDFLRYRMDLWRKTIDRCEKLSILILVMHAMNRQEYPYSMAESGIIKETLESLCDYASGRGVAIALENIPDGGAVSKDDISCTLRNQKKLFNIDKLRFCLDIGHAPLTGTKVFDEIDAACGRLVSFHVHNNNGIVDSHDLPDSGVLDWGGIYQYAREKNYKGEFVIEVYGGDEPEKKLKEISALFNKN